ncbi:efflux RND transporter periplasmic adaptor subunit, partial [Kineococcus glutinatus]|uniref:efflux RND transporter periplasmic adaptor subunit n=1 Tax=Kineococcus glutinatus TaxID=1070872 RepID=UPI0031EA2FFA
MRPVAARVVATRPLPAGVLPAVALPAVVLLGLLTGCSGEDVPPVRTAEVTRGDVVEVVEAPGTVVPRAQATLSAPAAGTVASLAVVDGQEVAAGQELFVVDSPQARSVREAIRHGIAYATEDR